MLFFMDTRGIKCPYVESLYWQVVFKRPRMSVRNSGELVIFCHNFVTAVNSSLEISGDPLIKSAIKPYYQAMVNCPNDCYLVFPEKVDI